MKEINIVLEGGEYVFSGYLVDPGHAIYIDEGNMFFLGVKRSEKEGYFKQDTGHLLLKEGISEKGNNLELMQKAITAMKSITLFDFFTIFGFFEIQESLEII
ncbi:hypothetical protein [Bacillus sp. JJ1562]|uniref:hypothetical protein n=1 Tax=Bacillus sp. JJ1562 TaxID=3122960 RepID=UPI003001D85F